MELGNLTDHVIGAGIKVQRTLGPGLMESAYRVCLAHELRNMGLSVQEEDSLAVIYEGLTVPNAFRLDLLVNGQLVVELKTVEKLLPVHQAQVVTYLRFSGHRVGLLLNFWAWPLKAGGIKRLLFTH
jgi:GxxExxY protein